eukprot:366546-Chlamydomonas_euryale.AAC.51
MPCCVEQHSGSPSVRRRERDSSARCAAFDAPHSPAPEAASPPPAHTHTHTPHSALPSGFTIDTQALDALIKRYDRNRTGALALDQFIRLSLFMHSATRTFSAFDTQRSNKVQFNFSQFIYASSHVV